MVKFEVPVWLLRLVELRLRTANSTTSACCFMFKKNRRQYSRIKLLVKDLGCPPINTAIELSLCVFVLRLLYVWRHSDGSKSWSRQLHSGILSQKQILTSSSLHTNLARQSALHQAEARIPLATLFSSIFGGIQGGVTCQLKFCTICSCPPEIILFVVVANCLPH